MVTFSKPFGELGVLFLINSDVAPGNRDEIAIWCSIYCHGKYGTEGKTLNETSANILSTIRY